MNLSDIMQWTNELAGCGTTPADSQVYVEAPGAVKRVLFGVDIDATELLWAKQEGYDAVIAHHPLGDTARTDFARVVERQIDQMGAEGIAPDVARKAVDVRLARIHRATHMSNINRLVDTARLMGMPLMNIHLACDIISKQAVSDAVAAAGADATVGAAIERLNAIPELAAGLTKAEAWLGDPAQPLGRHTVAIAGGTNGGFPVFREYFGVGVDTIFTMHVAEDDLQRLAVDPISSGRAVVVTGHMATDSIGINVVIDGLEERGIAVTRTSGIVAP